MQPVRAAECRARSASKAFNHLGVSQCCRLRVETVEFRVSFVDEKVMGSLAKFLRV